MLFRVYFRNDVTKPKTLQDVASNPALYSYIAEIETHTPGHVISIAQNAKWDNPELIKLANVHAKTRDGEDVGNLVLRSPGWKGQSFSRANTLRVRDIAPGDILVPVTNQITGNLGGIIAQVYVVEALEGTPEPIPFNQPRKNSSQYYSYQVGKHTVDGVDKYFVAKKSNYVQVGYRSDELYIYPYNFVEAKFIEMHMFYERSAMERSASVVLESEKPDMQIIADHIEGMLARKIGATNGEYKYGLTVEKAGAWMVDNNYESRLLRAALNTDRKVADNSSVGAYKMEWEMLDSQFNSRDKSRFGWGKGYKNEIDERDSFWLARLAEQPLTELPSQTFYEEEAKYFAGLTDIKPVYQPTPAKPSIKDDWSVEISRNVTPVISTHYDNLIKAAYVGRDKVKLNNIADDFHQKFYLEIHKILWKLEEVADTLMENFRRTNSGGDAEALFAGISADAVRKAQQEAAEEAERKKTEKAKKLQAGEVAEEETEEKEKRFLIIEVPEENRPEVTTNVEDAQYGTLIIMGKYETVDTTDWKPEDSNLMSETDIMLDDDTEVAAAPVKKPRKKAAKKG